MNRLPLISNPFVSLTTISRAAMNNSNLTLEPKPIYTPHRKHNQLDLAQIQDLRTSQNLESLIQGVKGVWEIPPTVYEGVDECLELPLSTLPFFESRLRASTGDLNLAGGV